MRKPILIAGSLYERTFLTCLIVGILVACMGLLIAIAARELNLGVILMFSLAGILLLSAFGRAAFLLKIRQSLDGDDHELRLITPGGVQSVRVADVQAIGLSYKLLYENGAPAKFARSVLLTVADEQGARQVKLAYKVPINDSDPFSGFWEQAAKTLIARAKADLAAGRSLLGPNWELRAKALNVGQPEPVVYPRAQIAAASVVDNDLCIWERGQERPSLKFPADSINAYILLQLLAEEIAAQEEHKPEAIEGLGRIIFERNQNTEPAAIGAFGVTAALALVGAVGLYAIDRTGPNADELWSYVMGLGAIASVCGLIALALYAQRRNIFRCHQVGVVHQTTSKAIELRYDEVGAFTWSVTRHFTNGVYTHTALELALEPLPGLEKGKIKYSANLKGSDDELDDLRAHIANVIARRMLGELREDRIVQWTPNLRLTPTGVEYRPAGFMGRKNEWVELAYADITGTNFIEGFLHVFTRSAPKSVIQEGTGVKNFFPGFHALMMVLEALQTPAEPASESGAESV
jgi:hypothetical protein